MGSPSEERGQAAAELIAVVPLLLVVALVIGQLAVAGWALVTAGEAARAGARAAHVDSDPRAAAQAAVPGVLGPADIGVRAAEVEVTVRAPALFPGLAAIPVSAVTALDPAAGAG